jgi:hypothetical protein
MAEGLLDAMDAGRILVEKKAEVGRRVRGCRDRQQHRSAMISRRARSAIQYVVTDIAMEKRSTGRRKAT